MNVGLSTLKVQLVTVKRFECWCLKRYPFIRVICSDEGFTLDMAALRPLY